MQKTSLTIGLFDKETEKQEINAAEAIQTIANTLINTFNIFAFTMIECNGVYKMASNGCIVFEPSIRIEIATDDELTKINEIVTELKTLLNQESIMTETEQKQIYFK